MSISPAQTNINITNMKEEYKKQHYLNVKKWRLKNPEKVKQYLKNCLERRRNDIEKMQKIKEYQKQWKLNNKEKWKITQQKYRKNNKEKFKVYKEKWILNNKEKYLEGRRRKNKIRRLKLRFLILERDNFTCQYCGRKAPEVVLEIDHIYPKSKGGLNKIENYKTSCKDCNLGKSDYILKEFQR